MRLEHTETLAEILLLEKQDLWEQAEAEDKDLGICVTDSFEGEITIDGSGQILVNDNICGPTINITVDKDMDEQQMKTLAEVIAIAVDTLDIEFDEDHIVFSGDIDGDCVLEEADRIISCGFDQ
jgi:hypothetical protein